MTSLKHNGRLVYINGYACVWNALSHPVPELGNRRCLFLPNAFSDVLKRPSRSIKCEVNHAGPGAVIGSTRDANLEIWEDTFGLAFQTGALPATDTVISTARSIIRDQLRGASTRDEVEKQEIRMIDGEEVVVIHSVKSLVHVAPGYVPQNPYTAVWLSIEDPCAMPLRVKAVAELWAASKPRHNTVTALREMARKVPARKPAPVPLAMHDIYPAGLGFSSAELDEAAFQEAAGRRMTKESQTRTRARQRARRAA